MKRATITGLPSSLHEGEGVQPLRRAEMVKLIKGNVPLWDQRPAIYDTAASLKDDAGYKELAAVFNAVINYDAR